MEYALKTNGLTKQYGRHKAVDRVSLRVKRGEIYGFIGRNGAGKTTFMKMACGLASPTAGELELFGAGGSAANAYRGRIGCLIEAPGLYPKLNGYENLKCKCLALGVRKANYENSLLEMVGLAEAGKKKVKGYSLGMKQRLGIAMALAGEPDLLLLDEPINGLDPQGIAEMRDILLRLKEEKNMTILASSHVLEELFKVADTFGIIHEGKLLQEISHEELQRQCSDHLELNVNDTPLASTVIERMGIRQYRVMDDQRIYIYETFRDVGQINSELVQGGCTVRSLRMAQDTLEDYYFSLTGGVKHA